MTLKQITVSAAVLRSLFKPAPDSYKGQNGALTIIGGSREYHGAPVFAVRAANRFVDYVFFYSPFGYNCELVRGLRKRVAEVMVVGRDRLDFAVYKSDCILAGMGLRPDNQTKAFIESLIRRYKDKKFVLDAGALRVVEPRKLGANVLVTPHAEEFRALFECEATPENAARCARKFGCVILLKGRFDYVADGKRLAVNRTGNAGMTKGGTGDVLAGLAAALACKNDLFTAACAAAFVNGVAGDLLFKRQGFNYNASDLIEALPEAFAKAQRAARGRRAH
ncbi:MAG: NAD(P)H-hydrate dehydratase [Candidatus Norongarragalinales archaeon]